MNNKISFKVLKSKEFTLQVTGAINEFFSVNKTRQQLEEEFSQYNKKTTYLFVKDNPSITVGVAVIRRILVKKSWMDDSCVSILSHFAVHPQFRKMGYGQEILKYLISSSRHMYADPEMVLLVHKDNKPAIKLYEKAGFVIRSKIHSDYLMNLDMPSIDPKEN